MLVLVLALIGSGATAVTVAAGMPGTTVRLVGENRPVDSGAIDPLDLTAHNSPRLVANPTNPDNLVVASRIDAPQFSCGLHVSLDGGGRWSESTIPFPPDKLVSCFSPDAAFGPDGTLYVAFSSFGQVEGEGTVPDAVWVTSSTDGGATMTPPVQAAGPQGFHVRVAADPSRTGRLYLAWLQAAGTSGWGLSTTRNPIVVARSDDGGRTWGEPVRASEPARDRLVAPALTLGADGALYLAYLDVRDDALDYHGAHEGMGGEPYPGPWSLLFARSSDGGATWSGSEVDSTLVPIGRFIMLFPPRPSVAVDGDAVFVAFHDGRAGDADVWLWRSGTGGRSWSKGRRVNDTPMRDGTSQYLPKVEVSPGGRVDVAYYDRRTDADDVLTEVSLQSSFDGGNSFARRVRLSRPAFDSSVGFGSDRGMPELGDTLGLFSADDGVLAMWADTRAGTSLSGKQNLAQAVVAVTRPSPMRGFLCVAGLSALALGIVLLMATALVRLRARSAVAGPPDGAEAVL